MWVDQIVGVSHKLAEAAPTLVLSNAEGPPGRTSGQAWEPDLLKGGAEAAPTLVLSNAEGPPGVVENGRV